MPAKQESPSRREPSKLQSGYSSGDVLQVTARPAVPQLKGSCHCGSVIFSFFSRPSLPYILCYFSFFPPPSPFPSYPLSLSSLAPPLSLPSLLPLSFSFFPPPLSFP